MLTAEDAEPSWLVRAVPGLLLGCGLVAMAGGMLLAARAGVNPAVSKQISVGPFDVLLVYSTPTPALVVAGLLVALAAVLLVVGLDAWAAQRVTRPARSARGAAIRPLRSEATPTRPSGPISVTALIPARNEESSTSRRRCSRSVGSQSRPPTCG